jgi:hypothetical protein
MDTASGQLGTWIHHQVSWEQGYSIRSVGNMDTASGLLGTWIQHQVSLEQRYSIRSVGDMDTASGQLGTWIQHQVSWGQGFSIRSVGMGYTTKHINLSHWLESLTVNESIVTAPRFDPSTSNTR